MHYRVIPVTPYQQNCSLVWCNETRQAAVIDPGGEVDRILSVVREEQVELKKILLTHGHMDHVGGTAELSGKLSLPIEGPHIDDNFWIQQLENQAKMMGFAQVEAFQPSRWLKDGDRVSVGKLEFSVIHCPGHTPGHVIFYSAQAKLAFVGDVLFNGSIGRTDFPRGNHDDLVASIKNKLWPLGDDVRFLPGHGPMSNFGHERKSNPFVADSLFG